MLVKVASKDTETVIDALIKNVRQSPQELFQSLTWDRGKKMADQKCFYQSHEYGIAIDIEAI